MNSIQSLAMKEDRHIAHVGCFLILILISFSPVVQSAQLNRGDLRRAHLFATFEEAQTKSNPPWHWVCANTSRNHFRVTCEDLGINGLEGYKEELQIEIFTPEYIHSYGLRHAITRRECRRIRRDLLKISERREEVCVRGELVNLSRKNPIPRVNWLFDEAKSKTMDLCEFNGCE